jgi:hypothetical protein
VKVVFEGPVAMEGFDQSSHHGIALHRADHPNPIDSYPTDATLTLVRGFVEAEVFPNIQHSLTLTCCQPNSLSC